MVLSNHIHEHSLECKLNIFYFSSWPQVKVSAQWEMSTLQRINQNPWNFFIQNRLITWLTMTLEERRYKSRHNYVTRLSLGPWVYPSRQREDQRMLAWWTPRNNWHLFRQTALRKMFSGVYQYIFVTWIIHNN